jgi:hypothetical protein
MVRFIHRSGRLTPGEKLVRFQSRPERGDEINAFTTQESNYSQDRNEPHRWSCLLLLFVSLFKDVS